MSKTNSQRRASNSKRASGSSRPSEDDPSTRRSTATTRPKTNLEKKIAEVPTRNLDGSLEQVKEEMRDAYMTFKDLQQRCVIDFGDTHKKEEDRTFYFKPDTFLLDEPEKQRGYRDALLKKISGMPKPEPLTYLGDELHRSFNATIADQSQPTLTKRNLALYYKRRQYSLQHLKYKLLCRWAHHTLTCESLQHIGSEATFLYGKLEYSLEQAMQRFDRLNQDDSYDEGKPENRPGTKAELGSGSLYVEKVDLLPQSLIKEDDVEIYIRGVTYSNKVSKVVNKFISRLKWLPLEKRYEIFEKAIQANFAQKQLNIEHQTEMATRVKNRVHEKYIMTPEVETELREILDGIYINKYQSMFFSKTEKIMHSWKPNHDQVPDLVNNQQVLKLKIQDSAIRYNLHGDIELDHGYSFSNSISVFFPTYFQKQVIKGQFSLYDVFAENEDKNQVQKRTLMNMTQIDSNIFRDLSTSKHNVPTQEGIQYELRNTNIKIIRLKSAAYWIDYVCLVPTESDWHKQQQAILNNNNPIDTLLKSGFNFLDVNDLASVNRINEDNAILHQQALKRQHNEGNPHNQIKQRIVATQDGEKKINVDNKEKHNSLKDAYNLERHLLKNSQGGNRTDSALFDKESGTAHVSGGAIPKSSMKFLPAHLIVSYYTLRFMKSRDAKTRILYALNFFRAIQKRLSLDLREFGTRERVDSHLVQPFTYPTEANKQIINQLQFNEQAFSDKKMSKASLDEDDDKLEKLRKLTVFDAKAMEELSCMASMRQYKCNGYFNNQIMSTCPAFPKFQATFGEPTMKETEDMEMDANKNRKGGLSEQALKLMGRIDHIELNEVLEEVYVKDDFGIYILYDCALQDMKCLEEELIKTGSYFVSKSEILQDPHTEKPYPCKDRLELIDELVCNESKFQFKKVRLIQAYMECYEHVTDPLEQQTLMQVITDVMARRPRLNLQANYFADSYAAELQCLDAQFELVTSIIDTQVKIEQHENKRLQDSLSLSYTLANLFEQNKWKYQDAEALLSAVVKKNKAKKEAEKYSKKLKRETDRASSTSEMKKGASRKTDNSSLESQGTAEHHETQNSSQGDKHNTDEPVPEHSDDESSVSFNEAEYFANDDNQFSQLLGLPEISIETLYSQYKEKDKTVLKLMNEHANFIQVHEGYPDFLNTLQGGSNGEKNKSKVFRPCPWSQEVGNLDFYQSLNFATKLYATQQQVQQELYDALKPYDSTIMTYIDLVVAKTALAEFRKCCSIMEGGEEEYKGRQYIEDESIVGNSEKMIFYAKEMVSSLQYNAKHLLDPFVISKMDVQTIKYFEFPQIPRDQNKYSLLKKGVDASSWLVISEKEAVAGIAKKKAKANNINLNDLIANSQVQVTSTRNVKVPSMLELYCNLIEFMRLRHELILTTSETQVLKEVYQSQCKACNLFNIKSELSDGISFEQLDQMEEGETVYTNYFDDGPAADLELGLAVREFDNALTSNLNFRSPDGFKLCITSAGLEELRAVLTYQVMQKQLYIIATRTNQLVIDTHQKALSEIKLIQFDCLAVPNSIIRVQSLLSKNLDALNTQGIKELKSKYTSNLSNVVGGIFYNIQARKNQSRTSIGKEFSNYQSKTNHIYAAKPQCTLRIMRAFKLKLLHRYCQNILLEAYLDAQKVQAVQLGHRLRYWSRYFSFDMKALGMSSEKSTGQGEEESMQIFDFETSNVIESFPAAYELKEEVDDNEFTEKKDDIRVLNPNEYRIINHLGIPSTSNLLEADASPFEDVKLFRDKLRVIFKNKTGMADLDSFKEDSPEVNDVELELKKMVPSFTFEDVEPHHNKKQTEEHEAKIAAKLGRSGGALLDYEEAMYFGDSKFGEMLRYYQNLDRVLSLEWFIYKLQFKQNEVVHLDHAIDVGLPFWQEDEFDLRVTAGIPNPKIVEGVNPISQKFFYSKIVSHKSKRNFAEELGGMAQVIKNFVAQFKATKPEQRFDYLQSYTEFRFSQIIGSMHKLIQQFYYQKNRRAVKCIKDAISQLTKMDHVKVSFQKSNSYHVNTSIVHPSYQLLEASNLIAGVYSEDERQNFARCVQPVINEKALEPPQITLFQSLYQHDSLRKRMPTQFAGQFISTHNSVSFQCLNTALLDMSTSERQYAQSFIVQSKYQANDFMETVFDDYTLSKHTNEDVYNIQQLNDAKKFLNDQTQALLLKNAVMCWTQNQVLPECPNIYQKYEDNFRKEFFWRMIEQKEQIIKTMQQRGDIGNIPTEEQLEQLQFKIKSLEQNHSLATQTEEQKRDALVKALREEFQAMKKKVTMDNYYATKSEILVLSNEIEKYIIRASVRTLDAECSALARCFTLAVPNIQMHIHPFQQFAATFYDQVNSNSHLDVSHKVQAVQTFLTKLRNRGTEVETLTSGPGMVFTIKDINECLQEFCRSIIKYAEKELKSRSDLLHQKEDHYQQVIYVKDQKIGDMERRLKNQSKNLENLIDARLFEKGNQLIYELDSTSRLLQLYKQTMFGLEHEIESQIVGEQQNRFKRKQNLLDKQMEKFNDYKYSMEQLIKSGFAQEEERIKKELKAKVDIVKNIEDETGLYKSPNFYPATGTTNVRKTSIGSESGSRAGQLAQQSQTLAGTVIPQGFTHYTHCSCYMPNQDFPKPTMEMAELEMLSEQEARFELARVCELMRKQRLFWRTKEMLMTQKYQDKINLMKKQLSNNSYLWEQMAESEKREKILKQELLFTQQSLSAAEKVIEKLQEEMKKIEAERSRLAKYKHSKAERLKELEDKIKKFEVYDNIDTEKLISVLSKKDVEVTQLKGIANNFTSRLEVSERRKEIEVAHIKNKFHQEQVKTQKVIDKMEQMKLELKMLESNDSSVAAIWKKKCLDLFEVCQTLKQENEELRDRCKELIVQGIQLAGAMNQTKSVGLGSQASMYEKESIGMLSPQPEIASANHVSLPKLQSTGSMQKMNKTSHDKQGSGAVSSSYAANSVVANAGVPYPTDGPGNVGSGRQGISTANTYEFGSTGLGVEDLETPVKTRQEGNFNSGSNGDGQTNAFMASKYATNSGNGATRSSFTGQVQQNRRTNYPIGGKVVKSPHHNLAHNVGRSIYGGPNSGSNTKQHVRGRSEALGDPSISSNYNVPQSQGTTKSIFNQQVGQQVGKAYRPATNAPTNNVRGFLHSQGGAPTDATDQYYTANSVKKAEIASTGTVYPRRGVAGGAYHDQNDLAASLGRQQEQHLARRQQQAHNDSLFESSKGSAGQVRVATADPVNDTQKLSNSYGKRTFQGGQRGKVNMFASTAQRKAGDMRNAAVLGSQVKPQQIDTTGGDKKTASIENHESKITDLQTAPGESQKHYNNNSLGSQNPQSTFPQESHLIEAGQRETTRTGDDPSLVEDEVEHIEEEAPSVYTRGHNGNGDDENTEEGDKGISRP